MRALKYIIPIVVISGVSAFWFVNARLNTSQETQNPIEQAQEYFELEKAKYAALEEQYRNDPYGGDTPEATLALYIDALERGDIETAVNLYAVEDRDDARGMLAGAKYMKKYIEYLKMENKFTPSASGLDEIGIVFGNSGEQIHYEKMKLNTFSRKWKLMYKKL